MREALLVAAACVLPYLWGELTYWFWQFVRPPREEAVTRSDARPHTLDTIDFQI